MKKTLLILLSCLLIFSIFSCDQNIDTSAQPNTEENESATPEKPEQIEKPEIKYPTFTKRYIMPDKSINEDIETNYKQFEIDVRIDIQNNKIPGYSIFATIEIDGKPYEINGEPIDAMMVYSDYDDKITDIEFNTDKDIIITYEYVRNYFRDLVDLLYFDRNWEDNTINFTELTRAEDKAAFTIGQNAYNTSTPYDKDTEVYASLPNPEMNMEELQVILPKYPSITIHQRTDGSWYYTTPSEVPGEDITIELKNGVHPYTDFYFDIAYDHGVSGYGIYSCFFRPRFNKVLDNKVFELTIPKEYEGQPIKYIGFNAITDVDTPIALKIPKDTLNKKLKPTSIEDLISKDYYNKRDYKDIPYEFY